MTIGDRLKDLRTYEDLRQKEMAAILGVNHKTVSAYEKGYSFPSLNVLVKAANYFDVSVDYILGRTDNPKSHKNQLPENILRLPKNATPEFLDSLNEAIELMKIKYKIKD